MQKEFQVNLIHFSQLKTSREAHVFLFLNAGLATSSFSSKLEPSTSYSFLVACPYSIVHFVVSAVIPNSIFVPMNHLEI